MRKIALIIALALIAWLIIYKFNENRDFEKLKAFAQIVSPTPTPNPATDWPQLQHDAQRTGRTTNSPGTTSNQYRLRWLWLGPSRTIRNHLSNSAWPVGPNNADFAPGSIINNVLTSGNKLPKSVDFTINWGSQVIAVAGKIFIGDIEGHVYAINADDGSTLWTSSNDGGTLGAASYTGSIVVWGSISGHLRAFNPVNGALVWDVDTKGAITSAPVTNNNLVCAGNQIGYVTCVNVVSGMIAWTSPFLGAPIAGGVAMDENSLYVGAENMVFYALNLSNGQMRASKKVKGQTFQTLWPVIWNGKIYIEAGAVPAVGSEYVMEGPMADSIDYINEQSKILAWMQGQGGYSDASVDWQHLTVLNTADFSEPFKAPVGPFEGLGKPPYPPVIDNQNRVLTYFKTKWPTLTKTGVFGSNYSMDISAIDQNTGARLRIGSQLSGIWWWDTDNLYIPSVAGDLLVLHHSYHRGIYIINIGSSNTFGHWVKTIHRHKGTEFSTQADVTYLDDMVVDGFINSAQDPWSDRNAAIVSGGRFYASEQFGVVAIEKSN